MMNSRRIYSNPSIGAKVLLSFLIPTYKNNIYLSDAIDSILSVDNINEIQYEIIVISNDPDGNLDKYVEAYKDKPISFYINEENYGQVGNLNQAINISRGKYISILHDDDLILPNYYEAIKEYITASDKEFECIIPSYYKLYKKYNFDLKHRLASFVFGFRLIYRRKLQLLGKEDYLNCFDNIYGPPSCGVIFLKKAIKEFGLFKDERGAAWDYYNFRTFHQHFNVFLLHEYCGIRRSDTGMSSKTSIQKQFWDDKLMILDDEGKDNPFLVKYKATIITRKPITAYVLYRIKSNIYYYSHNLDGKIGVTRKLYKRYMGV